MNTQNKKSQNSNLDHEAVMAHTNHDIKVAMAIVSASFNVAMLSIMIGLQFAFA